LHGAEDKQGGFVGQDAFTEVGEGFWEELAVVIGKPDPLGFGVVCSEVSGNGCVGDLLTQVPDREAGLKVAEEGLKAVVEVLIDDEDFDPFMGRFCDAAEAGLKFLSAPEGWDDEREPGLPGMVWINVHRISAGLEWFWIGAAR